MEEPEVVINKPRIYMMLIYMRAPAKFTFLVSECPFNIANMSNSVEPGFSRNFQPETQEQDKPF